MIVEFTPKNQREKTAIAKRGKRWHVMQEGVYEGVDSYLIMSTETISRDEADLRWISKSQAIPVALEDTEGDDEYKYDPVILLVRYILHEEVGLRLTKGEQKEIDTLVAINKDFAMKGPMRA